MTKEEAKKRIIDMGFNLTNEVAVFAIIDSIDEPAPQLLTSEPDRLMIAAMCLQGILASSDFMGGSDSLCSGAFDYADELIAQSRKDAK
jgi:hypothetical protein